MQTLAFYFYDSDKRRTDGQTEDKLTEDGRTNDFQGVRYHIACRRRLQPVLHICLSLIRDTGMLAICREVAQCILPTPPRVEEKPLNRTITVADSVVLIWPLKSIFLSGSETHFYNVNEGFAFTSEAYF